MRVTIQKLLQEHLDDFAARHRLSPDMFYAAVQLRDCRTAAMGGHVNSCPDGHVDQIAYNSCRHRLGGTVRRVPLALPVCFWFHIIGWVAVFKVWHSVLVGFT